MSITGFVTVKISQSILKRASRKEHEKQLNELMQIVWKID